ncbi:MAG: T9SS type B sorting domain-containing protein [Chitinophagaceae bacterium]|nr:T9SS type B sorting domain-containing protein [Chitinophagaceae bacterium]
MAGHSSAVLKNLIGKQLSPEQSVFIKNVGQYDHFFSKPAVMGKVEFGFEGLPSPVLFTPSGIVFIQHKKEKISHEEEEELEKQGLDEEDIEHRIKTIDKTVFMQWVGSNPSPLIIAEGISTNHFTYGDIRIKAFGYKRIIYKELYPGIDLVYHFTEGSKKGFEYSFIIRPGADAGRIKMLYGGDIESIKLDNNGQLAIRSKADTLFQSVPFLFSSDVVETSTLINAGQTEKRRPGGFRLTGKTVSFIVGDYDHSRTLVIDPFIGAASGFTGLNGPKAKDVDFDYQGNIYVTGGGEYAQHQLSKYNSSGVLQWTFNGAITFPLPDWAFGVEYGGWAVEKSTGKVYLGQGFIANGTRIIRLDANGLYDNFISTQVPEFRECWKMIWNCSGGNPQILLCGGSTANNVNFSLLSPPSTIVLPQNITNNNLSSRQDIADGVVDPLNNDMYTIYANRNNPSGIDNFLFKHTSPYSSTTIAWQLPIGFTVLDEANNRPYLHTITASTTENSINALALNSNYLFYWDGKNLKAFNKTTGADAGTPFITSLTAKMQGGIYADECNNVFIGYENGLIKVFRFNGSTFDDALVPDITITGYATNAVYDLAYNGDNRLLYASGDGFIASFDISSYCPGNIYVVNVVKDCPTLSITATLAPAPPIGSIVTYSLYDGATLVATNTTGIFNSLSPVITYTVKAIINQACSGIQATPVNFTLATCNIMTAVSGNAICGGNNGTITASASFGTAPYTYSLDGVNFQVSNTFTGLTPNTYTVTAMDALGVTNSVTVTVANTVPSFSITPAITQTSCGNNNGIINVSVTGGVGPYQYSLDGINFQASNIFNGLAAGSYTVTIRDQNNCVPNVPAVVAAIPPPTISNATTQATCNLNNGTITATPSGGTAPYQYSIDGVNFQPSNIFAGLAPATYTITIRDANSCIATSPAIITAIAALTSSANTISTDCTNNNGSITVNVTGGTAPYSYSLNTGPFQASNIFNNLATGNYTIDVKDVNNCTTTIPVTIGLINTINLTMGQNPEICEGSSVTLNASATNAATYSWLPATGLSNPAILQPVASPASTTIYTLTATAGPCNRTGTLQVRVNPRPIANAGPDQTICNKAGFQLSGNGGVTYQWSPATYLNNASIQNPFANNPSQTITYTLHVTDAKGCTSAQADAVTITIRPPVRVFAGNDTAVVNGQPLQLTAIDVNNSGLSQFTWAPVTGLNNPFIANPVALPPNNIRYIITATTSEGCTGMDDIYVRVFARADIYVPTAFTPNNDNLNDFAVAIPVGILTFRHFTIYNRWGELVFTTTDYRKGWDGKIQGQLQGSATFAWVAEAVDYKGNIIQKKGLVTLIR